MARFEIEAIKTIETSVKFFVLTAVTTVLRDRENVIGFQFDPIRRKNKPSTDADSSWESCYDDVEENTPAKRSDAPVDYWCKCGKRTEMVSIREN